MGQQSSQEEDHIVTAADQGLPEDTAENTNSNTKGSDLSQDSPDSDTTAPKQEGPPPLRSVHTSNFPMILEQLGISLAVSTYQAGKLVFIRNDGGVINTHFRAFNKPMGMAVKGQRLALGTAQEIWEFRNIPAVANRLDPPGKHDACYMPRAAHITGDIQIHEMAYVEEELWFINTRFSCLATQDLDHSFCPRWRPSFVTQLAPEDRCHLNGLGLQDGRPRWATALGETNQPGGWRENKSQGGILLDIETNQVVSQGLSMPHSPRWHNGRLWLLESGTGSLGHVDLQTGRFESIIQLDGFTRGMEIIGNLAFIGLSQVRETAVFSNIQITERLQESQRTCGVWVVDLTRGETIAFLKFEDAVQEIFAVVALSGMRYPDLINDNLELISSSFVLPDAALEDVPQDLRAAK
jgi:uncharacterized protein (TIGR03032 family)